MFSNTFLLQKKRAPKTSPVAKKEGKKKNPWSDSDGSDVEGSDLSDAMDSVEVAPRERAGGKRAAASKAKFKFVSMRLNNFIELVLIIEMLFRTTLRILTNLTLMKSFTITQE